MKCPSCCYEHGSEWDEKKQKYIEVTDGKGDFYTNKLDMERDDTESYHNEKQTKDIHGCPSCGSLFMDV